MAGSGLATIIALAKAAPARRRLSRSVALGTTARDTGLTAWRGGPEASKKELEESRAAKMSSERIFILELPEEFPRLTSEVYI